MDLTQQKLTKSEWEFLEVPVNQKEKKILNLIYNGFENTRYTTNESTSLLGWMKIGTDEDQFHLYMYEENFSKIIKKITKKYDIPFIMQKDKKTPKKLQKKDLIRIKNGQKKLEEIKLENDETVKRILDVLDTKIRPAVARDGGDIKFKSFENGVVKVELQGSCSGCPSSLMTLKQGVQNLLKHYVKEVNSVEAN